MKHLFYMLRKCSIIKYALNFSVFFFLKYTSKQSIKNSSFILLLSIILPTFIAKKYCFVVAMETRSMYDNKNYHFMHYTIKFCFCIFYQHKIKKFRLLIILYHLRFLTQLQILIIISN